MNNNELKLETLKTASNYINNIIVAIDNIVEYFQKGESEKGLSTFNSLMEGLEWLTKALSLTNDIQKDPVNISEINVVLTPIEGAINAADYTLVCDILSYELKPLMESWQIKL